MNSIIRFERVRNCLESSDLDFVSGKPPTNQDSDVARLVGKRLRAERVRRGMTQAQLADAVGVAPQAIYMAEHGKSTPSLERCAALARCLDLPLSALVADPSPDPNSSIAGSRRKWTTNLDSELLDAFRQVNDLSDKKLIIQIAKRLRSASKD